MAARKKEKKTLNILFTYGSVGKIFDSAVEIGRFSQRGRYIFRRDLIEVW